MADKRPMDEVVDHLTAYSDDDGGAVGRAPAFADPLTDAYSVAAASIGAAVRQPDAHTGESLPADMAVTAASDLTTSPVDLTDGRWPPGTSPLVAHDDEGPVAVVPARQGPTIVRPGSRTRHRARGAARAGLQPAAVALVEDLPRGAGWFGLVRWSLRRRPGQLWALLVMAMVGGLSALFLPLATQAVFNWAVPQADTSATLAIIGAFIIASIGATVILVARNLLLVGLRDESDSALSLGVMARALRLPTGFFRRRTTGDLLNRVLSAEEARGEVGDDVPALVIVSAFGLVNIVYLAVLDPLTGLLVAIATAILVAGGILLRVRARQALVTILEERSAANGLLLALAEAIVPIRVRGAEERALARWAEPQGRAVEAMWHRQSSLGLNDPIKRAGPLLVVAVLVISVAIPTTAISPADFMAAYAAILQLVTAIAILSGTLVSLSELGPTLERIEPIMAAEPEDPGPRVPPGALTGALELRDVTFGYTEGGAPLVNGLSLRVEPGEFVAIVGPSGSGKSTLMRLMLGFERPWAGAVMYDRIDLAELDLQGVRRQVGTVLQAAMPFGDTAREAVAGPRLIPDDRLWQILDDAGLGDHVRTLDGGLDASIGRRGDLLSGGQRQRLMIARALAGDPRIILLDEATSALDNETQEIVMRAILDRPVTRVAIAHRLSTVARADRVVVVAGGRIVEEGPPDQLLRAGGHFAALAARQEL